MKALTLFLLTFGLCAGNMNVFAKELTKPDANELIKQMGDGTELTIPAEYTKFSDYVFAKCDKIKSVKILGEVDAISQSMFKDCVNLQTVRLPEGVKYIHMSAFEGCSLLKNINFPISLVRINREAFRGTALEEITLLNIEEIGEGAFMFCEKLNFITLPYSVRYVAQNAFVSNSLERKCFHILGCGGDQEKKDQVYQKLGDGYCADYFFDGELALKYRELEGEVRKLQYELDMSHKALACPVMHKPCQGTLVNAISEKAKRKLDKAADLVKQAQQEEADAKAYMDMINN